jgi:lincosamide nucleotidyltransferase B/F
MIMHQDKTPLLHQRLNDIAQVLSKHPLGLGLLGLGSSGKQSHRMDIYSDLDFFALVAKGSKLAFIEDLGWLSAIKPIVFCFRNTYDGYKLLFDDGVFCEFAIFEPAELVHIPFEEGLFIWRDPSIAEQLAVPNKITPAVSEDVEYLLGELLTNLYVGMSRYRRGEKLSAIRFIQVYAIDRLVNLLDLQLSTTQLAYRDAFCIDRRAEQRHPSHTALFEKCLLGSDNLPEVAATLLAFTAQHYAINAALKRQIENLILTENLLVSQPHSG